MDAVKSPPWQTRPLQTRPLGLNNVPVHPAFITLWRPILN